MEWHRGEYTISTERGRLDLGVIQRFISEESYWGQGRSLEVVRKSVENSVPFGVYHGDASCSRSTAGADCRSG
jgi:hypothetical protein